MSTPTYPSDLFNLRPDKSGNIEQVPNVARFADWLTSTYRFIAPVDSLGRNPELYVYDPHHGYYRNDAAVGFVHKLVEGACQNVDETAKGSLCDEVVRSISRRSSVPRQRLDPEGHLSLGNGVLQLDGRVLRPHSPDELFTAQLPIHYSANATCPNFLKFLGEVLPSESHRREIQKLFGYCFIKGQPYQCAHIFLGQGNNGKSTLLQVLTGLLGQQNVSNETLQGLSENRFSTFKLVGKFANIFADLPSARLVNTSCFKALTGGDGIVAEGKFRTQFYFRNSAKLIFSCNELPETADQTPAFWRRLYLIPFDVDFTGREDRNLLGRIQSEYDGILRWSLDGMDMLLQDGGFRNDVDRAGLKDLWQRRSDNIRWFCLECVDLDPLGWVSKRDFYEFYSDFCARNRTPPRTLEIVGKALPLHVPTVRTEARRLEKDGPQVRGWTGIAVRAVSASSGTPNTQVGKFEAGEAGEAGSSTLVFRGARGQKNRVEDPAYPASPASLATWVVPQEEAILGDGPTLADRARANRAREEARRAGEEERP